MRVAVLMPVAEQRGGAEVALLHLVQHPDVGVEWLVIFLEDGPMVAQFRELGVSAHIVLGGRLREPHRFAMAVGRIAAILRRERAACVVSWMGKPHLYGSPAAGLAGVPALWFQMGLPDRTQKLDVVATMLPARGIFTCSETAARAQRTLWPRRVTRAVPLAVDLERFDPDRLPPPTEMRLRLGLPAAGPVIGIVGRLQRWKGMHVLLEAMPQVLETHPDAHCVIVGGEHALEADYPRHLDHLIESLNLSERVTLAGLQKNVPEWMQAMDVVVHASRDEPFGIVLVEAMALGKPLVAGDTAGPTEIVTDGVNGLLTPYGDAGALACALLRYLDDPALARQIGDAARVRAQDFSTRQYALRFVAELRGMIQSEAKESCP